MPRPKSTRHSSKPDREKPLRFKRRVTREQRNELRRHGFKVNKTGIYLDSPRDKTRKKIKGARMSVLRGGIVKWSVGRRRDFIVGFTAKEKKEFARDPEAMVARKEAELIRKHPQTFRRAVSAPRVRLQWGAYQATKDFSPYELDLRYPFLASERPRKKRDREAKDRLVGLIFITYVKRAKRKKKK
jgi:hypothetical protein